MRRSAAFWIACLLMLAAHAPGLAHDRLSYNVVAEHYPPYEMETAENGLRGFDYDVMTEVFARMGYAVNVSFLPWKRAVNETRLGAVVGLLTCAYLPSREEFILYSDPISNFTSGFFVRADYTPGSIERLDDILGRRVASVSGYESLKVLQQLGAEPVEVPTSEQGLRMLKAERFDYFYAGEETTRYLIRQSGMAGDFTFLPLERKPFHFCFSRAHPDSARLLPEFNAALDSIRADGTYDQIHGRYR